MHGSWSGPVSEDHELGAESRSGSGTGRGQGLVQSRDQALGAGSKSWSGNGRGQGLVQEIKNCQDQDEIRNWVQSQGQGQGLVHGSRSGPGSEDQELGAWSRSVWYRVEVYGLV